MRRGNASVVGIANADSISAGCAKQLHANGYNIIPTYLNEKALTHVKEDIAALAASIFEEPIDNSHDLSYRRWC